MLRPPRVPLAFAAAVAMVAPALPLVAADPASDVQSWLGCADWIAEQTANTVAAWRTYGAGAEKQVKCKLKYRATPIKILRDQDLYFINAAGVMVPNQANGVVGGSGTATDPFVIGGFEFDARVSCPAILIEHVTYHVRIAGNWIHDTPCSTGQGALRVKSLVKEAIIEHNLFSATKTKAMQVMGAYRVIIRDNVIETSYGIHDPNTGVMLAQGRHVGAFASIDLSSSYGAQVAGNILRRGPDTTTSTEHGIWSYNNMNVRIHGNHVTSAWGFGITNMQAEGTLNAIHHNTIVGTVRELMHGIQSDNKAGFAWTIVHDNTICNAARTVIGHVEAWNNGC